MYGAIIGDLAGSIYEFEQTKSIKSICINNIIEGDSFFSDDTILTIAILDAVLNDRDYDKYLRYYIKKYSTYKPNCNPYFKTTFSPNLIKWSESEEIGNSLGNGAMMRISPIGYMFDNEEDVIKNAKLATMPSHNSIESIDAATTIALIIFYLRKGLDKEEILKKLNLKLNYTPFKKFNTTCNETIDNCLYIFFNSNSFLDAIKKTILLGGDTDTNACIVGSMAEAAYGIDKELIELANNKIPIEFKKILCKAYKKH
ncbi:MAG: ADP-ribosylglycohydrolase family protein [Bacilli bacterium]|nr:ADP-ribosylglycohydrolase family protein [Bacilli bacterium]